MATTEDQFETIPLLARYAKKKALAKADHWYDEDRNLNVTISSGELKPIALLPNSVANLKTKTADGAED